MKTMLLIAAAMLVAACSLKPINRITTIVKDSVVYQTKTVYDTVKIYKEDVALNWINVLGDTSSIVVEKRKGRADLHVTKINGLVTAASCECDSLLIVKKFLYQDTLHNMVKITDKTETILVPVTSKFDRFCRWFFIVFCVIITGYSALKLLI